MELASYYESRGGDRALATYWRWLKVAARAGDPSAQTEVGVHYLFGMASGSGARVVRPAPRTAVRWLELAAAENEPTALHDLGYCHDVGLGVPQDTSKALELYKRAWRYDASGAAVNIAVLYRERGDHRRAFHWFAAAAARGAVLGDGDGFFEMGLCCFAGLGVLRDDARAADCLCTAARSRYISDYDRAIACYLLGLAYLSNRGRPFSRRRGLSWMQRAVEDYEEAGPHLVELKRAVGAELRHEASDLLDRAVARLAPRGTPRGR